MTDHPGHQTNQQPALHSSSMSLAQVLQDTIALRLKLLKNGYQPLPAEEKAVLLKGWNKGRITKDRIQSWEKKKSWANTGIRCRDDLIAVDIDVTHAGLAATIADFTREQLGAKTLERVGHKPKKLLLYRRNFPLKKQDLKFRFKGIEHQVEILADGQQFVGFGVHPDTGKLYEWSDDFSPLNTKISDLDQVDEKDLNSYFQYLADRLVGLDCEILQRPKTSEQSPARINRDPIALEYLEAAMEHIPADDYEIWTHVGMALHYETRGDHEGFEVWDRWSQTSPKYDETRDRDCEYRWSGFHHKSDGVTGATIIKMASEYGFDTRNYYGPRADYTNDFDPLEALPNDTSSWPRPEASQGHCEAVRPIILNPPGLVGSMADFSNKMAHKDQPLLGICAGLVTVASLSMNRFIVERSQTPLNIYIVAVAETGAGKEAPRKAIKKAHEVAGCISTIKDGVASGPALIRALSTAERHAITLLLDEFGRFLQAASHPNNGYLYELITEIMKLYGLADSTYAGKIYSNPKDNIDPVPRPCVNLFGTTTSRSLTDALSSKDVDSGNLNRLLVVITGDHQSVRKDPEPGLSDELKKALQELDGRGFDEFPNKDDEAQSDPILIPVDTDAKALLKDFEDETDKLQFNDKKLGALWARGPENATKVAGILSVGCAAENEVLFSDGPVIDKECASWAITFARWCIERLVHLAQEEVGDNETQRVINKMRGYLIDMTTDPQKHGAPRDKRHRKANLNGWVTKAQITKRFQVIKAIIREEALKTLVDSEDVRIKTGKDGRTKWYSPVADA